VVNWRAWWGTRKVRAFPNPNLGLPVCPYKTDTFFYWYQDAWVVDTATGRLVAKVRVARFPNPASLCSHTRLTLCFTYRKCAGHLDFSFAAAWHPDGVRFATGNQDTTTRVWDIRHLGQSLAVLKGKMGAVRSLRFSRDGDFLLAAEPADFTHVYDVKSNFTVRSGAFPNPDTLVTDPLCVHYS
jgi:WD40 repeat protein